MVSNAPGEYSLHIPNVNTDDAGTHRCVLTNEQWGAELIVIGKVAIFLFITMNFVLRKSKTVIAHRFLHLENFTEYILNIISM